MRKLVIFVTAFSLSILLSVYLLPDMGIVIGACLSALFAIGFIFFKGKNRTRYFISCIGLATGFIYIFVYSSLFIYPAQKYIGTKEYSTVIVNEYPKEFTVDATLLCSNERDIHISLYCPVGFPENTKPGDKLSAYMEFSEVSGDYLYTSGIKLYARAEELILDQGNGGIKYLGTYAANFVKNTIDDIFSEDVQPFVKALITGDKTDFYDDPVLDHAFRAAGLSHIVAVSGMHLTFLLALPAFFVRNRRRFSAVSVPLILFFMAFSGFSPSVCRAGIMHLCINAANLFDREPDDYTSLFISIFIILLFDPFAAASISLQLSFASVLGIIAFAERIFKALAKPSANFPKPLKRVYLGIIKIFSASIGALILSTPISALYFGQISVVAPIISVFVLSILSLTFCLCIVSCIAGSIFLPAGIFASNVTAMLLRLILWIAKSAASSNISSIYTANTVTLIWLVCTYLLFAILLISKRPAKSYIVPICISLTALCAVMVVPKLIPADTNMQTTVLDVGQGQCIVVTSDNMTAVIDCGSSSEKYAGEIAEDYLRSRNIDKIDIIIVTHYHADHVNGVSHLLSEFDVKMLITPIPEDFTTYDDEIISVAGYKEIEILYIENDLTAEIGSAKLFIYKPLLPTGENERCAAVLCTEDNYDILITGDMPAYCELLLLEHASIPDIEVLIAGHHGSAGSSSEILLKALKPETAIISVGENQYGHPAEETLSRFSNFEIAVFRTDILGHITITKETSNGS